MSILSNVDKIIGTFKYVDNRYIIMYVEKRNYYGRIRYWLSHSFREGGKIHKIRKLLGTDLSKEVLEDRKIKAQKLILDEINKYKIKEGTIKKKFSKKKKQQIK